ncbi:DUF4817 domain-containing protein [Aphis craccivora]|uniref:DUF4817 domain-containing protein n=1 Tax=Aphis craccivora TaxID=307492 RepID=A0A6G0ZKF7_APHCR|nr:DUF4817 domain-containing protein [Aphis craccivora]
MERFTVEQRVTIVKTHYKCGECVTETLQKHRTKKCAFATVTRLLLKFEKTGSVVPEVRQKLLQGFSNTLSALVVCFHYCYALFYREPLHDDECQKLLFDDKWETL